MAKKELKRILKTIDLFAGIWWIRIAFENAGFQTVFSNDAEPYCKKTFDINFKDTPLFVDKIENVKSENIPDFDILLGGFPCQPFSIAGYRKWFNDKWRGDLFFQIIRILEDKKPEWFLLENVKNLFSHDKWETYKFMKEQLESLGYHVTESVLNTVDYGNMPQNRERIYIVWFKDNNVFSRFKFPEKIKLTQKLKNLLDQKVPSKYYYNGKALMEKLVDTVTKEDTVYQWRRIYVRENKSWVCPTLTANMWTGWHNVPIIKDAHGIRKLTPRECFRIQWFPDSYILPDLADSRLYKQAGNSVSVPVIQRIAENMILAFDK